MWPFKRRKKALLAADEQLALVRVGTARLKLDVGKALAESNPELAARLLWGGGKAVVTKEKSLADLYLEKKILGDGEDPLDQLDKLDQFYERKFGPGDDRGSSFERALERFGGPLIEAAAMALNPAGYQNIRAQLQAEQQQPGQVVTEVRPRVPIHELAELGPQQEDHSNVVLFAITPQMVLTNLAGMPPSEFARWALGQQAVAGHMQNLANCSDEELGATLASAESNPLFGAWRDVFGWLRQNPERTTAIIQSVRALLAYQTEDPDDVAL